MVAMRTLTAFRPGAEEIGQSYLGEVLEHLVLNETVLLHTPAKTFLCRAIGKSHFL